MKTIALTEHTFNIKELENSKPFISPSGCLCIYITTKHKFACLALQCPYLLCQEKKNFYLFYSPNSQQKLLLICLQLSSCTMFYTLIPPLLQRVCLSILMHRTMVTLALTAMWLCLQSHTPEGMSM